MSSGFGPDYGFKNASGNSTSGVNRACRMAPLNQQTLLIRTPMDVCPRPWGSNAISSPAECKKPPGWCQKSRPGLKGQDRNGLSGRAYLLPNFFLTLFYSPGRLAYSSLLPPASFLQTDSRNLPKEDLVSRVTFGRDSFPSSREMTRRSSWP